jgi:hypothetical protein
MTYLLFKGLLKGKNANLLTKQSDLSKKPEKTHLRVGFLGFFKRVFLFFFGWVFLGGFFNANPGWQSS